MKNEIYNEFKNPGVEFRGKPFWSWNGRLEKDELIRQIHVMKEMGFGGFFMHSRTGLVTEYLGEEWFELINACAEEAEKLGMEAWLYDEDRWPSGSAGGLVTKNPEYRMKYLKLDILDIEKFRWNDDIIAAFSCELQEESYYNLKQLNKKSSENIEDNKSILAFKIVEMDKSSFYNGYTYLDTLNREATQKFIEITHEKYKKECKDKFGDSIKGIFIDEPHRGALMSDFGDKDGKFKVPWTYTLFEEFENKYGYDLRTKLPELFLCPQGRKISQVKWHYVELLQQMFLDNFAKPINKWCQENDLILTGHVLQEDSFSGQTAMNGSVMRFYEHMGYPGVDILSEGNRNYWVVKQAKSAARQLGKDWVLSELYGCTGWQMSFESHKAVGDWQALFGINLRCPHLSWYTMEGQAKRDYPASILHQSTWWQEYDYVEDYFSRIGVIMSQGEPVCDVLVLNPIESVWSQIYSGWVNGLNSNSDDIQKLEKKYRNLFHWLAGANIDFDYGDESIIDKYYEINEDEKGQAVLKVGKTSYKVVIVGGMVTLRSSTLKILKKFERAGGNVIFAGKVPQYLEAVKSNKPEKLSRKVTQVSFNKYEIIKACRSKLNNEIQVLDAAESGTNIEDIYCQLRNDREKGKRYLLLMNMNREQEYRDVKIKIKNFGRVEEWDCETGKRYDITSDIVQDVNHDNVQNNGNKNDYLIINTDFPPGGEHLYVIFSREVEKKDKINNTNIDIHTHNNTNPNPDHNTTNNKNNLNQKPAYKNKEKIKISDPFSYKLSEPNVCVLDMAQFRLNDGQWQKLDEILKIDQKVRAELGMKQRSGDMIQPWYARKYEQDLNNQKLSKRKTVLDLKFPFYIDRMPADNIELVIERPSKFEISINENHINSTAVQGWWVDKSLKRIEISREYLKDGKNHIYLKVDFDSRIDLEAMYLLGQFGVKLNKSKKHITILPDKLEIGDIVDQGLPFYSGKVDYIINTDKYFENENIKVDEKMFISLSEFEAACVKVKNKDDNSKIMAWTPYETDITDLIKGNSKLQLEVILTRRNTFGPLHHKPLYPNAYGPGNFISAGERFSKSYMLIPSGLIAEPEFIIKK